MNQYDQFSLDYHWLYSDNLLSAKPFFEQFANLLDSIPSNSKLLDCSCGIGVHAVALAQRGFSVWGSDSSPGMIAQAQKRSRSVGIKMPFSVSTWQELPQAFSQRFDGVICLGNSIGHCNDRQEMVSSFQGIRAVLKVNGVLVLDSRNWEKLRHDKKRFTTMGVRVRNGIRCFPLYVWSFPSLLEEEHLIEVVFIFEDKESIYERHYPITYHPFRYTELCERLSEAGFSDIQSNFAEDKDSYTLIAHSV